MCTNLDVYVFITDNNSILFLYIYLWLTLISSKQTRPVTNAVVVAIAGMIFPAINLLCKYTLYVKYVTKSFKILQ